MSFLLTIRELAAAVETNDLDEQPAIAASLLECARGGLSVGARAELNAQLDLERDDDAEWEGEWEGAYRAVDVARLIAAAVRLAEEAHAKPPTAAAVAEVNGQLARRGVQGGTYAEGTARIMSLVKRSPAEPTAVQDAIDKLKRKQLEMEKPRFEVTGRKMSLGMNPLPPVILADANRVAEARKIMEHTNGIFLRDEAIRITRECADLARGAASTLSRFRMRDVVTARIVETLEMRADELVRVKLAWQPLPTANDKEAKEHTP